MSNIIEVTDQTFKSQVLDSDRVSIVDFWASWCMPCRIMAQIIEEFAGKNNGKIQVCKLNTDTNRVTASKYKIISIPSLVFFRNGQEVHRIVGVQPVEVLQAELDKVLEKNI